MITFNLQEQDVQITATVFRLSPHSDLKDFSFTMSCVLLWRSTFKSVTKPMRFTVQQFLFSWPNSVAVEYYKHNYCATWPQGWCWTQIFMKTNSVIMIFILGCQTFSLRFYIVAKSTAGCVCFLSVPGLTDFYSKYRTFSQDTFWLVKAEKVKQKQLNTSVGLVNIKHLLVMVNIIMSGYEIHNVSNLG